MDGWIGRGSGRKSLLVYNKYRKHTCTCGTNSSIGGTLGGASFCNGIGASEVAEVSSDKSFDG